MDSNIPIRAPCLEDDAVQLAMQEYLADGKAVLDEQRQLRETSSSTSSEADEDSNRSNDNLDTATSPPTTSQAQDLGTTETIVDVDAIYEHEFQRLEAQLAPLHNAKNTKGDDEHNNSDVPASDALRGASRVPETSKGDVVNDGVNNGDEDGKFTCFGKFPLEIRLKIWKATFVKRHVDFDLRSCYAITRGIAQDEIAPTPYIPATLAVNKESRTETLKHYSPFFIPRDLRHPHIVDRELLPYWFPEADRLSRARHADRLSSPGWVNPSLDSIFIRYHAATNDPGGSFEYEKWFDHLAAAVPKQMSKFRQLEVRNVWLYYEYEVQSKEQKRMLLSLCQLVKRFSGLKTILLTGDNYENMGAYMSDEELEEFRDMMLEILAKFEDDFVAKKVPDILTRNHEDLDGVTEAFE